MAGKVGSYITVYIEVWEFWTIDALKKLGEMRWTIWSSQNNCPCFLIPFAIFYRDFVGIFADGLPGVLVAF